MGGPTSYLPGQFPPLEWPTKQPKPLSYDWDPAYIAAGEAQYAKEKAENMANNMPATYGNRLVRIADDHFRAESLRNWNRERTERARLAELKRRQKFKEKWVAAVRDGAPGETLSFAHLLEGRPVPTCDDYASTVGQETEEPNYEIKPAIPYRRQGSDWLTYISSSDEEADEEDEEDASDERDAFDEEIASYEINIPKRPSRYFTVYQYYKAGANGSSAEVPPQRALHCPNGNASHTQTRTWISLAEKERVEFKKLKANTRHAGLDQSPFMPKTFGEYLVHKQHQVISNQKRAEEDVRRKEKEVEAARQHLREGGAIKHALPTRPTVAQKLADLEQEGKLTMVMARPSIWTAECLHQAQIVWPERAELRASVEERGEKG